MDFDKAGSSKDLGNEKFQRICKLYNGKLLPTQRVVDGINSMNENKFEILCKCYKNFSLEGIEELLSDESIVNHINNYDDEVFRSILDCASSELNILEILKGGEVCNTNNEFESSDSEENEEDYGYYDNSDYEEDEKNDLNNFAKEALGNKGTNEKRIDDGQSHNINHVIFIYMTNSKKFADKDFTKLYDNKEILERINSVTDERFELILSIDRFDGTSIIELLENQNAARNIDLIDKETLKYIIENDKFSLKDIIKLLENQEVVERINSVGPKKSKIILNSDKFNDTSVIVELLKNKEVAENINLISEGLLKYIVKSVRFSKVLKDREFIKLTNLIDSEKSKSVFRKFDHTIIIELLENQEVVKRINSMNSEIFNLIFKYLDKGYIMNLLKYQSLFDQINSLDGSKVSIMISNNFYTDEEIVEILKDQSLLARVNSIDLEKLELISNSSKFYRPMIMDLLKSQNFIDSINTEKFRLLLNSIKLHGKRIITLLKDQNAVKHINSVNNEELKAITDNVTGKVFVNIFKNFKPSVKSTLRLAIILRKAGKITDINIDYLNNKERIYEDIIKYVPQELSIDIKYPLPGIAMDVKDLPQKLDIDIKSFVESSIFKKGIACEEPTSTLYNLSLAQVIENINPHKRARYS